MADDAKRVGEGSELDVSKIGQVGARIRANIERVMVTEPGVIDLILVAALSEGHVLLEDVPGVGKTMLARATAISLGGRFGRLQCTPDLLPSDVVGISVYDGKSGTFEYRPGPVMAHVVLADEINRATPRTQSSLLECMAEGQVTVDGVTHKLPRPFLVLATQNPIEYEGTFPLPEAQLDRFFLRMDIGYPTLQQEHEILRRVQESHPIETLEACTTPEEFLKLQHDVRRVHVEQSVRDYAIRIVQATRSHGELVLGASPRGSIALVRAAQAYAALDGRSFIVPDDIKRLAVSVLSHRVLLRPEARLRGRSAEDLLGEIIAQTPVNFEDEKAL